MRILLPSVLLVLGAGSYVWASTLHTKEIVVFRADSRPFNGFVECDGKRHDFESTQTAPADPAAASVTVWGATGQCRVQVRGPTTLETSFSYGRPQWTMYCKPNWEKAAITCFDDD